MKRYEKMRDIKPLNDYAFKQIFVAEGQEDVLKDFLNTVLAKTLTSKIETVKINNETELRKYSIKDKMSRLDLRATLSSGEDVNIEVQQENQHNMARHFIYIKYFTCPN